MRVQIKFVSLLRHLEEREVAPQLPVRDATSTQIDGQARRAPADCFSRFPVG